MEPVQNLTGEETIPFEGASEKELKALKMWLFSENVRITQEKKELQEMQNKFIKEKLQFQEEMKILNQRVAMSQQRLKQDEQFFEKKMDILKGGFYQLEQDRAAFEKEKQNYRAGCGAGPRTSGSFSEVEVGLFFAGVKNPLALKKRYKDLLKIFHPDNLAGDKEMVQMINEEYERIRKSF